MAMQIPWIGQASSLSLCSLNEQEEMPLLWITGHSHFPRFAVQLSDHGLEGLSVYAGDYLIFTSSGWPTHEGTVCFLRVGDESIIRRVENVYATEPILSVTGDRSPSLLWHRNDFIVQGQLVGIIRPSDVLWVDS